MNRSILLGTVCLLFAAWAAPGARAQGTSPAASGQAPAPAAQQPPDQSASVPPAAPSTSQKKVWTNEDIGTLREDSTISTFQPKGKNGGNRTSAKPQNRDANWYRQQIENLQKKIPPIDAKIAELQKGMNGETVNDPTTSSRPYGGVRAGSWQMQVNDLQAKRADIVAKISGLEDQARHAGVSTNEVP